VADVGSTTFGFLVAYLLPGLSASIAAALWFPPIARIFEAIVKQQNLALGALGAALAITAGIFLTLFRALIFEEWLCRADKLAADEQAKLADDEQTFRVFRSLVDGVYRYHQFWGAMVLVLPFLMAGLIKEASPSTPVVVGGVALAIVVEIATFWAAYKTYERYVQRTRLILERT
jgi:Na+/melibiose symporter-like transporter